MRFRFIQEHIKEYPVELMCRVLEVSRSGYYAWRSRPESTRSEEDRRLKAKIRAIHRESREIYGAPRVHAELKEEGERCGRKRVARLMREEGLEGKQRRKFKATTDSKHSHPVAANLLDQKFEVEGADRVWLGDITYIPTGEGWLYLAAVMDLYSRRIVGWSTSARITQELTLEALAAALEVRRPEAGLIHHSDRGSQYTCESYQKVLRSWGLGVSMSRKGNCYDNAPMESFFGSLKSEWVRDRRYQTREEARADLFAYIEVFYNRKRRHSSLGYLSPVTFEQDAA